MKKELAVQFNGVLRRLVEGATRSALGTGAKTDSIVMKAMLPLSLDESLAITTFYQMGHPHFDAIRAKDASGILSILGEHPIMQSLGISTYWSKYSDKTKESIWGYLKCLADLSEAYASLGGLANPALTAHTDSKVDTPLMSMLNNLLSPNGASVGSSIEGSCAAGGGADLAVQPLVAQAASLAQQFGLDPSMLSSISPDEINGAVAQLGLGQVIPASVVNQVVSGLRGDTSTPTQSRRPHAKTE